MSRIHIHEPLTPSLSFEAGSKDLGCRNTAQDPAGGGQIQKSVVEAHTWNWSAVPPEEGPSQPARSMQHLGSPQAAPAD